MIIARGGGSIMQRGASSTRRWYLEKVSRVIIIIMNEHVLGRELLYELNSWGMIVISPELGHQEKGCFVYNFAENTGGFRQTNENQKVFSSILNVCIAS